MNPLNNIISPELSAAIGETFMHSLWQVAAIGVLLVLAMLLVKRNAALTRYRLGAGAMALMIAMPIITFLSVYTPGESISTTAGIDAAGGGFSFSFLPAEELSGKTILEQIEAFFNANGVLVMALWLIGALFFSLRLAGGYLQVRNLRRRYTSPAPASIQATLAQLIDRMGIRKQVTLMQSAAVTTPMVVGALKPVILVPVGLATGLNSEQIECLLAHELAHIRRMDYLVNIFQSIVEIILFFHPVVWMVSRMVREERENCCDQAVIDIKENRITYARALLNLETIRQAQPELAMASTGGKLFRRIQRITGQESVERGSYSRGIFLGLFSLLLILALSTSSSESIKAVNPMGDLLPPELQFDRDQQGNIIPVEDTDEEESEETTEEVEVQVEADVLEWTAYESAKGSHFANNEFVELDSPITAIVIIEDGKEVRIRLDRNGQVVAATIDGRKVAGDNLAKYQELVDDSFQQYAGRNGRKAPMPAMPPMPDMSDIPTGNMPPLPPLPDMKNMPKLPAPPAPKEDNESDEDYEKRMEVYEDQMETWGEEFEVMFENQDWGKFEEDMEVWGEKFGEKFEKQFEGKDWEKFGRDMEEWGERFGAEIEVEMENLGRELAKQFEHLEDHAREMEEDQEELEHGGQMLRNAIEDLRDELAEDDLVDEGDAFRMRINDEELYINGDKQGKTTHAKYRRLIEEMDIPVEDEEWIDINFKRGKSQIRK